MGEHYSKNTVEASAWCNPCRKATPHRIDNGRKGSCLECLAKLKAAPPEEKQPRQLLIAEVYGVIDVG